MEKLIQGLFQQHFGVAPTKMLALPLSGSARRYYRLSDGTRTFIGVHNENREENCLFIRFTRHFEEKGMNVPHVYCVSEDGLVYIQQDLGADMLLDVVERERKGEMLPPHVMGLYRKALSGLLQLQLWGGEGLDYSECVPRPVFDEVCIRWDLNYFKYCFLRLAGVDFSEQRLENDFDALATMTAKVATDSFMFRDFQSRNIMVQDDEVWFIDYQGGRQGALAYDVASLLYDAIARIPEVQREVLLEGYVAELKQYREIDAQAFKAIYYRFVLLRLLQAMGAFGLRGLHERKQHFIDSIVPGLDNVLSLFVPGKLAGEYPEIESACRHARAKY